MGEESWWDRFRSWLAYTLLPEQVEWNRTREQKIETLKWEKERLLDLLLATFKNWHDWEDIGELRQALYQNLARHVGPEAATRMDERLSTYSVRDPIAALEEQEAQVKTPDEEPTEITDFPTSRVTPEYMQHASHCNQGEYEGVCKYGDGDCPILEEQEAQDDADADR